MFLIIISEAADNRQPKTIQMEFMYGFRPGGGDSSSYFLDVDGNFLALKPGQGSIIANLTPDRLIIYYFTITN